jgi:hypothetical protein
LQLYRAGIQREIVLLQAESEDALRKTHRRYFEDLATLSRTFGGVVPARDARGVELAD